MVSPKDFVEVLKKNGFLSFTGVPCSFFQAAINFVIGDPGLQYTMVPNEGSALAFAAGSYLAGQPTALMIQNSGLGNLVNPLTSLNIIYGIPVLIFISGRAYGVEDEPQHEVIGKTMGAILDALGVRHQDMPDETAAFERAVSDAAQWMKDKKQPFVFFVRKGSIDEYVPEKKYPDVYPLKRIEAIRLISQILKGDEYVIATTGKPSRELFSVCDRSKNFYMQGSMGHAAAIGLGVAMNKPQNKVVVLDGDGAILMHQGILSSVGHYQPKNFYHLVLDNESYETTGDQDTTSSTTDLVLAAKAAGYVRAEEAKSGGELEAKLASILKGPGPAFLRVKINRVPTPNIPRISGKHNSRQIAETFKTELAS